MFKYNITIIILIKHSYIYITMSLYNTIKYKTIQYQMSLYNTSGSTIKLAHVRYKYVMYINMFRYKYGIIPDEVTV